MTDFRHAGNPEPFTQLLLETETAPLTQPERDALWMAGRVASSFAASIGVLSVSRGDAAKSLAGLTEAIDQARRALLRAQRAERKAEGRQT